MEPRPDRPAWLPAEREPDHLPAPSPPSEITRWRRVVRSPRGSAGLAILAAALLLWPFADWSVIPWLVGLAVLVLLYLLRLDGPLRGWAPHVSGVAVVVGLMVSTTPWAWAFAASIGVLLAGLVRLPRWRLVAVGAVLCLVTGAGFAWSQYRTAQQRAQAEIAANVQSQGLQGATRAQGVLPVLLNRIAQNVPEPVCDNLLSAAARDAFARGFGQVDCPTAVASVASRVADRLHYADGRAPTTAVGDGLQVDACTIAWPSGSVAGPQLGRLTVGRKPGGSTYVVTAFTACGPSNGA